MSLQYGELRPTNGWDRLVGLGHPIIFQRISRLGSVTARQSSSGRQPDFAALNRRGHLFADTVFVGGQLTSSPISCSFHILICSKINVFLWKTSRRTREIVTLWKRCEYLSHTNYAPAQRQYNMACMLFLLQDLWKSQRFWESIIMLIRPASRVCCTVKRH